MKTSNKLSLTAFASLSVLLSIVSSTSVYAEQLDTINITADFRPTSIENSTASVSVLTDDDIEFIAKNTAMERGSVEVRKTPLGGPGGGGASPL